jgi:HAD superfamily hydrolase (TIGR01509 family)
MNLDIDRIQAICFDVDGTLRDTDDQYMYRFAGWLRPFRAILPQQDELAAARWLVMFLETPGNWVYGLPDLLHIDHHIANAKKLFGIGQNKAHQYLLIDGIPEMLEKIADRYPLAVVSARGRQGTLGFLNTFGLTPYFSVMVTALTTRRTKPRPDPILWAAMQMNIAPQHILMVGDTVVDIKAGKAAGCQTVGVLCGFGTEQELRKAGADLILPSTADLPELLFSTSSA